MARKSIHVLNVALVTLAVIIFIAGQSIDFLVFKYQQNIIQSEIKQKIKNGVAEKDLTVFKVTLDFRKEISWKKIGKEFSLNNRLYDIVKMENQDGVLIWKCINDTQETNLFAQLDKLIQNRLSENPANGDYYKNLAKDYIKNFYNTPQPLLLLFRKKVCPEVKVEFFCSRCLETHSPPPEFLG